MANLQAPVRLFPPIINKNQKLQTKKVNHILLSFMKPILVTISQFLIGYK